MIFSSDEVKILDEIRTLLSFCAFIISLLSFYFMGLNWRESNRPIIVAYIDANERGKNELDNVAHTMI